MERPTQRTNAFVPRLGKREQIVDLDTQYRLERLLCSSYGLHCNHLEVAQTESSSGADEFNRAAYLALMTNLMRGIPTQEGNLRLTPNGFNPQQQQINGESIDLLDMMAQQQVKREVRASEQTLSDMLGIGTKRVAFTPRVG